jgi:(R,R)-butanediol dehydrogenase / meso-butanediol dehydrogenase / diacetyl reductase
MDRHNRTTATEVISDHRNISAVLTTPGVIEFNRSPLPHEVKPHYVRMAVAYCALCGSDLAFYRGRPGSKYPRTLGHEYCGTVILSDPGAASFQPGESVAVDPNYRCGQCFYCKSGASNLCDSSEANLFDQRGFSAYVDIHQAYLQRLPVLDPRWLGALIEPLSCALHALSLADVHDNDAILILGCGGQGSLLAFGLSVLFPKKQIAVYDPNLTRSHNLAEVFGSTVRPLDQPPREAEYSLIFEASGESAGFKTATLCLRKGGRLVIISRYRNRRSVYLPFDFPRKQPTVRFSHLNGDGQTFKQALEMLRQNWTPRHNALTQVRPFKDLPLVLDQIAQQPYNKIIFAIPA